MQVNILSEVQVTSAAAPSTQDHDLYVQPLLGSLTTALPAFEPIAQESPWLIFLWLLV